MKTNSPSQDLDATIALLKERQQKEWIAMKVQIDIIQENLKPLKIIKAIIDRMKNAVGVKNNILRALFRFGISYLKNKVIERTLNKFKNFISSLLSK